MMSSQQADGKATGTVWSTIARRKDLIGILMVLFFLTAFFIWPLAQVLMLSVTDMATHRLSIAPLVTLITSPGVQSVLWQTLLTSVTVSATCLIIAYPAACGLAKLSGTKAIIANMIILFPFLTSSLVRTFVFIILLGRAGVLNQFLQYLNIPGAPYRLLFNQIGVVIGMTYVLLPYMLLSLVGSMKRIDRSLLDAARSLGAGPFTVFWTVYLPLSLPGVAAGVVITTILGFGYFVTPALMGGPAQAMIAQLVEQQIVVMFNLNQAAGLSVIMLVIVVGAYVVASRFLGLSNLMRAS